MSESHLHPDRDVFVIVELDANGVRDGTIEALQEGEALSKQ